MKSVRFAVLAIGALGVVLASAPAQAQPPRKDVLWARSTNGAVINLDGVLSEPAWAAADSVVVQFGVDAGIPGSGWKAEAGILPTDPTRATFRFVTVGNLLYMSAVVRDKSVGGSRIFNRFDGLLMALKDHANANRPSPPSEYLYSWWRENDVPPADVAPGATPTFRGRWTQCAVSPPLSCDFPRTAEQIANWDAATTVIGISNDDNNVDADPNDNDDFGYIIEMKFNLAAEGYNITDSDGDVIEWNVSIYDCDWFWPFQPIFSANRVWYQNPWGNQFWYHNVRVYARPSVTITSGPAPVVDPEIRIPAADNYAAPVINGLLTDAAWQYAPGITLRYGDDAVRNAYPGVGPWRSGQFQPTVNGGVAPVVDPADAQVKWFFKGNILYLGFDVNDQVVQYHANFDRWDGFIVMPTEYSFRGPDNQLLTRRLTFQVSPTGNALAQDYLPYLRDTLGGAQLALALKPGSGVDTVGTPDVGYTAELSIDLTKLGYPSGLGDGRIFLGIDHLDGDSFIPFTDSYGTRVWWQREYEGQDGAAWGYLDPTRQVADVGDEPGLPSRIALLGNQPNPLRSATTLRFTLDQPRNVRLEVYDLQGRLAESRAFGVQPAGSRQLLVSGLRLESGLYLYRLVLDGGSAGGANATLAGKMVVAR